ncbi:MAG: hypothetical protein RhofKO_21740 [Rhodothermales bacterium]
MIRFLLIVFASVLCLGSPAQAQATLDEAATQFETPFKAANVDQLALMLAPRIDINLFGADKQYSQAQARFVLTDFFERYPPGGLDLRTPSPSGTQGFISGIYTVQGSGERLRLYARLVRDDDTWRLRELRLMRANP